MGRSVTILIRELWLKKFRNIGDVRLEDLRDLNILIGPNNCGKTNILEFLNRFSELRQHKIQDYLCKECNQFKNRTDRLMGIVVDLRPDDHYLKSSPKDGEVEASLLFDKDTVSKLILGKVDRYWEPRTIGCPKVEDRITFRNLGGGLFATHFSPFLHPDVLERIRPILYCLEGRLQTYKGRNFPDFINAMEFTGTQRTQLVNLLARLVDPRIKDYKGNDLIRKLNDHDLTVTIAEQGSGVRSLVCMAADILSDQKSNVILIDEPELGLNPFVRQELLRFLLDLAKDKQVFVATQDPAFVNPVLWGSDTNRISVYLFSLQAEGFVKVDLSHNKENPEVFAGYLPHTTSLKSIHIYVEGTSDVYIFQVLLKKFLEETFASGPRLRTEHSTPVDLMPRLLWKDRFDIENRIGIFHLCGDVWPHLMYTVPKTPYRCIVILDGDKKEQIPDILRKHNGAITNASKFEFAASIEDVERVFGRGDCHPVYCLQKNCIENYLPMDYSGSTYRKNVDGPRAAEKLKALPEELERLLRIILADFT